MCPYRAYEWQVRAAVPEVGLHKNKEVYEKTMHVPPPILL